MANIIPVAELTPDAKDVVENLIHWLHRSGRFGVTLQGTHLTLRWRSHPRDLQLTMVVESVDDGTDDRDPDLDK